MFKLELNYYVGDKKNEVLVLDETNVKMLWSRYLADELRDRGKNRVTIEEAAEAACVAFEKFVAMVKRTTIER